ncbi:MAG: PfkB family carbohydrate kinase [Nocardioides sp.]
MQPCVLVIGESIVDVVLGADGSRVERPGGSAANVAVALARLGRRVQFATAFADDERGALLAQHLEANGVELATDPHVLERTSSAAATIGPDGSASYVFDLDWRLAPVPEVTTQWVHVCSLGAVVEPGADEVLDLVRRSTVPVTYDINARPAITGSGPDVRERVEAVARYAWLVKASDEDLEALYPQRSIAEAAAHLLALGPHAVVVTRGADGLAWFAGATVVEQPVVMATVVDTIGAGDTVSAALIDALLDDATPAVALAHAAAAAAITVSRPGADPPMRGDLD